jgi:hypothetical protein
VGRAVSSQIAVVTPAPTSVASYDRIVKPEDRVL